MKRTMLLGAVCLASCTAVIGPDASTEPQAIYDVVWQEVDRHYSFFAVRPLNWDSIGAANRPAPNATSVQLQNAIRRLLAPLDDPHVTFRTAPEGPVFQSGSTRANPVTFFDMLAVQRYVPSLQASPSGRMRFGKATASIGYVRVPDFGGAGWGGEIADVLASLGPVTGIIFDVRMNGGGDNSMAMEIAGRFTDTPRLIGFFRYRNGPRHTDLTDFVAHELEPRGDRFDGRVVVLTDRGVASSAEDFVQMMRAIPGTTVIGDTTMGASGNPLMRELPNGWLFQLSEWIAYTPARQLIEWEGLAPDIAVKATQQDFTARIDRVLERAIEELSTP
jgi:C-terminal processing protease CtpA/Prc